MTYSNLLLSSKSYAENKILFGFLPIIAAVLYFINRIFTVLWANTVVYGVLTVFGMGWFGWLFFALMIALGITIFIDKKILEAVVLYALAAVFLALVIVDIAGSYGFLSFLNSFVSMAALALAAIMLCVPNNKMAKIWWLPALLFAVVALINVINGSYFHAWLFVSTFFSFIRCACIAAVLLLAGAQSVDLAENPQAPSSASSPTASSPAAAAASAASSAFGGVTSPEMSKIESAYFNSVTADELMKWHELLQQGIITEEEFEQRKLSYLGLHVAEKTSKKAAADDAAVNTTVSIAANAATEDVVEAEYEIIEPEVAAPTTPASATAASSAPTIKQTEAQAQPPKNPFAGE